MEDIPLRKQYEIAAALCVIVSEGHLMQMLTACEWQLLMRCNRRMKQAVESGMVNGSVSLHELALVLGPQTHHQAILSPIVASFPRIKSLTIHGEPHPIKPLNVPRWEKLHLSRFNPISLSWKVMFLLPFHPPPPPPLTPLQSFVATNISHGTFIAIEFCLGTQFAEDAVAFPSLDTLKVTMHWAERYKGSQFPHPCIEPENLSQHIPHLRHLHWPYPLMPADPSALLDLLISGEMPKPMWLSIAKQAISLERFTQDWCPLGTSRLRIQSFPPRICHVDMSEVEVKIDTLLPPTLVSFKCNMLETTDKSYLSAKNLPRSLTLLHVRSCDTTILRNILADLELVAPHVWANDHLPPKLHFLGGRTTMPDALVNQLHGMLEREKQALFSMSLVYPNVMYFYSHLQLQYSLPRDIRPTDETVTLVKLQSFINVQVANLTVVNELMAALWTLYHCRHGYKRGKIVDDAALVELLSECIKAGQLTCNSTPVDLSIYPMLLFQEETPTARLTCLRRWQAVAPWIWPNFIFRHGIRLTPNPVDATFLSVFFKAITSIHIECAAMTNDPEFLLALGQCQNLHSVFINCEVSKPSPGLMSSILSLMDHLPNCVRRLSVTLPSEYDCNTSFMLRVPASISQLEIQTNDSHTHRGAIALPTRAAVWWPSLARHIPTSTRTVHIDSSVSICEIGMLNFFQWLRRWRGGTNHSTPQLTFEIAKGDDILGHSVYGFWMPVTLTIIFVACLSVAFFSPPSPLQSILNALLVICVLPILAIWRH